MLRTSFVAKKRSGVDFGKLHVANSVILGTRVRTDILKAIANQFSIKDAYKSYDVLRKQKG